jgi:hypothetical protein
MKACEVFVKGKRAFAFTQNTTASGLGVTTGPMFNVAADDPAELGDAIRKCLEASSAGVPDPEDFKSLAKEMIRFAGERSWKSFTTGAAMSAIWDDGSQLKIIPHVPAERGSFDGREDEAVVCPRDWHQVGQRFISSLRR